MTHLMVDGICVICGGDDHSPCKGPTDFQRAVVVATKVHLAQDGWAGKNWHMCAEYIGYCLYEALCRVKYGAHQYVLTMTYKKYTDTETHYVQPYELPGVLAFFLKNERLVNLKIDITLNDQLGLQSVVSNVFYERTKEMNFSSTVPLSQTVQNLTQSIQEWKHAHALTD